MNYDLETPVVLFIYKRPEHTKQVLDRIKQVIPPKLFIIADGPASVSEERPCKETKDLIIDQEYPFPVRTDFASENQGLPGRFTSGLDWVFQETPEAIILEDDILPIPSFFRFCETMLDHFRGDERVMEITGRNQLEKWQRGEYSYHFSYNGGVWGWATWEESWEKYQKEMQLWENKIVRDRVRDVIADKGQFQYIQNIYDKTCNDEISSWAYRWGFARQRNNALSVVPCKNLIKNIGFDEAGTHTTDSSSNFANKEVYDLSFPLNHPPFVAPDREYDKEYHQLRKSNSRLKQVVRSFVNYIYKSR